MVAFLSKDDQGADSIFNLAVDFRDQNQAAPTNILLTKCVLGLVSETLKEF